MKNDCRFRIKTHEGQNIYFGFLDICVLGKPGKGYASQHIFYKGKAYFLKEYYIMKRTFISDKCGVAIFEKDNVRYESDDGYVYTRVIYFNGAFRGENGVLLSDMANAEVEIRADKDPRKPEKVIN